MIDGTAVPAPSTPITAVAVDDSLFVYDEAARRFCVLNSSAASIFEHCDGIRSVDQVAAALAERHPGAADRVRADVRETLSELIELGLLAWP